MKNYLCNGATKATSLLTTTGSHKTGSGFQVDKLKHTQNGVTHKTGSGFQVDKLKPPCVRKDVASIFLICVLI